MKRGNKKGKRIENEKYLIILLEEEDIIMDKGRRFCWMGILASRSVLYKKLIFLYNI